MGLSPFDTANTSAGDFGFMNMNMMSTMSFGGMGGMGFPMQMGYDALPFDGAAQPFPSASRSDTGSRWTSITRMRPASLHRRRVRSSLRWDCSTISVARPYVCRPFPLTYILP